MSPRLPLAEGVVERVVDDLRGEAQPRRGVAVDVDVELEAGRLLVGGDVLELGQLLERVEHLRGAHVRSSRGRRSAACTGTASARCARRPACPGRLEVELMPSTLASLRAQARDDLVGARPCASACGLSEMNSVPVLMLPRRAAADERDEAVDVGVRLDDGVERSLPLLHRRERDVLRGLREPHEQARCPAAGRDPWER